MSSSKSLEIIDPADEVGPATNGSCQLQQVELEFIDVGYTVVSKERGGARIDIIKHATGSCHSGRLLALMGHSGAGKTTLLDILACNIKGGIVTGRVMVNGRPAKAAEFQKINTYILQRDVLLATATVQEALMTSALLRLRQDMPHRVKRQRVESILDELDLRGCANTMIGDDSKGIKGISGGERRRVSVGIGLVTDPRIIFLDEPTSGLDSETAVTLITCIKKLALANRTVVCTIHQPNSDITEMFDDLLLLSNGSVVYYGEWQQAVGYFAAQGFQCPQFRNPSDYFMSITKDKSHAAKLVKAHNSIMTQRVPSVNLNELELGIAEVPLHPAKREELKSVDYRAVEVVTSSSWWYQVWVLSIRFSRSWYRDPVLLASMAGQYVFCSAFIGLMYLQLDRANQLSSVFDRLASLWLLLAVLAFTPCETACTLWDSERLLLRRETNGGAYGITAFFLAKSLTTIPFQVAVTSLYDIIAYFMIGYQYTFNKFFKFWLITNQFQLISETLGLLCAVATPSSTYAIIVASAVLLVLLSFTGFLISSTPVYFIWISKISYFSFAYSGLFRNEMVGLLLPARGKDGKNHLTPVVAGNIPTGGHNSLGVVGGNDFTVWNNIAFLFVILIGSRILLWAMLKVVAKTRWL